MNLNLVEWEKFEEIKEWISLQGSVLFVELILGIVYRVFLIDYLISIKTHIIQLLK